MKVNLKKIRLIDIVNGIMKISMFRNNSFITWFNDTKDFGLAKSTRHRNILYIIHLLKDIPPSSALMFNNKK